MEENKAKTTEAAERFSASSDSADAGAVTSERSTWVEKDSVNATEFSDFAGGDDTARGNPAEADDEKRMREQNRENARRRREAEKEALIRRTREEAIIEALDGRNPYTGEEIKDSLDVEEYLAMKEITKQGGDPISDYPKYRKDKERSATQTAQVRAQREEWYKNDREAFMAKYPNTDLDRLIADKRFRAFAHGKTGEMPLSEIYEGFVEFVGGYEEDAKKMAAQMLANHKASPGSLGTTQSARSDYYTPEQVRRMTPAEVKVNYEKIRTSMTKWK